jgi:anti-sigma-K factor RskA
MTNKELITSGELELYVAGLLSEERNKEIAVLVEQDEALKKEVEDIENVVMHLAGQATTSDNQDFTAVLKKIVTDRVSEQTNVKSISTTTKPKVFPLAKVAGWAAAAVFLLLFGFQFQKNTSISSNLNANIQENKTLKDSLLKQIFELNYKDDLLSLAISTETEIIKLSGQDISPSSKAVVFWNTKENKVIIDAKDLPNAPKGMVYQVWSLKLDPLTPTSIGLLEGFDQSNALFVLDNKNSSEAFGITLEPEGGSETPTLEKLFVLGTTNS